MYDDLWGKIHRHSTGLFLLATTESCVARIRRSLKRAKNQGLLPDNYIAVTKAIPRMGEVTDTVDVVMTKVGIRESLKPGMKHVEVQHTVRTLRSPNNRVRELRPRSRNL